MTGGGTLPSGNRSASALLGAPVGVQALPLGRGEFVGEHHRQGVRVGHARFCGGATLGLYDESPGSKPPLKMANALRSSYQCASTGFRQMVPPLPTSASHLAAFRSRLVAPFADKACLLFGLGPLSSATVNRLLTSFGQGWSAPLLHVTFVVYRYLEYST
jgi:hypothetical protein